MLDQASGGCMDGESATSVAAGCVVSGSVLDVLGLGGLDEAEDAVVGGGGGREGGGGGDEGDGFYLANIVWGNKLEEKFVGGLP